MDGGFSTSNANRGLTPANQGKWRVGVWSASRRHLVGGLGGNRGVNGACGWVRRNSIGSISRTISDFYFALLILPFGGTRWFRGGWWSKRRLFRHRRDPGPWPGRCRGAVRGNCNVGMMGASTHPTLADDLRGVLLANQAVWSGSGPTSGLWHAADVIRTVCLTRESWKEKSGRPNREARGKSTVGWQWNIG